MLDRNGAAAIAATSIILVLTSCGTTTIEDIHNVLLAGVVSGDLQVEQGRTTAESQPVVAIDPSTPTPPTIVSGVAFAAHTSDAYFNVWGEQGVPAYAMPRVPEMARRIELPDEVIACPDKFKPVAAWHEIVGTWPEPDVVYTVNAGISEDDEIEVFLRAREGRRGYAYVEVLVLCTPVED